MKQRISHLALLLSFATFGLTSWVASPAWAAKSVPPAPRYYVLDEPHVLPPKTLQALQVLLVEHDHATGEQIVIAIFNELGEEDLVDWTNKVFSAWGIGQRGKDNGVLLALYWKEHKVRIEVGYGLEPLLTDARSKQILGDFLIPELKNNNPGRGASLAAMEILRTVESPLIQSGKAEEILRSGGFRGSWAPSASQSSSSWIVWLILGGIIFFIVMNLLLSADAHFTRSGWYRPSPFPRRRSWRSWGGGWGSGGGGWGGGWGGGSSGGWGGGGGFSGGGGSSGGGGASGSW